MWLRLLVQVQRPMPCISISPADNENRCAGTNSPEHCVPQPAPNPSPLRPQCTGCGQRSESAWCRYRWTIQRIRSPPSDYGARSGRPWSTPAVLARPSPAPRKSHEGWAISMPGRRAPVLLCIIEAAHMIIHSARNNKATGVGRVLIFAHGVNSWGVSQHRTTSRVCR